MTAVANSAKGCSAVMAMKKPMKMSDGIAWEKLALFQTPPWATRAVFEIALPRAIECDRAKHRRLSAERCCQGISSLAARRSRRRSLR